MCDRRRMLIESGADSFYGVPITEVIAAWGITPRLAEDTQPGVPPASGVSIDPASDAKFPRR